LIRASDSDASWMLPSEVFPGTSNWEETPGKTQHTLEGLYLPAGLGTPRRELENIAGEREVWVSLLGRLPPRPDPGLSG